MFEGDEFLGQIFGCCFFPDWYDFWGTPYIAIGSYFEKSPRPRVLEAARLLRDLDQNNDDELLESLRRFHSDHWATYEADSARRFVSSLAAFLESGRRDPEFDWTPGADTAEPELVEDLGGAWSVASTFDDIEQANREITLVIRAKPELIIAFARHERPDIPTMRARLVEPCGTVILNDGRFVRGRTAVAVARLRPDDGSDYVHTSYLEAEVDDGDDPREDYPLLHLYLDGYLHQDWQDDYGTWQKAFADYLTRRTGAERKQLLAEIAGLRAQPPDEQADVIVRCHSYVVPSRTGEDDGRWLDELAELVQPSGRADRPRRRFGRQ